MKNHYLLTIAAGLAFSLAANAETLLPDSTVTLNAKGEKTGKQVYHYAENQQKEKDEFLKWDAAKSDWTPSHALSYTYDAAGNKVGELYQFWNGKEYVDSEITAYVFDDQNRMTLRDTKYSDGSRHIVESYKFDGDEATYIGRDTLWKADGSYTVDALNEKRILDDAGNLLKVTSYTQDWDAQGEDPVYYVDAISVSEYDNENRYLKSDIQYFSKAGDVIGTTNLVWEYNGKSYTQIQRQKAASATEWTVQGFKCEVKEGNPEEYTNYYKNGENGEWKADIKYYNYYPAGEVTANDAITAEPMLQVMAPEGTISITVNGSRAVQVYAITGGLCYSATVNGSATVSNLPAGIYVVRAGNQVTKVCVR